MGAEKFWSETPRKLSRACSLKNRGKDEQLLIEEIIRKIEKKYRYILKTENELKIMLEIDHLQNSKIPLYST